MIPVDKLRIGMRVTRLDRPWKTKFLYQGLEVRRIEEIEYLLKSVITYMLMPCDSAG